jgi:hypothetical protein
METTFFEAGVLKSINLLELELLSSNSIDPPPVNGNEYNHQLYPK